MLHPSPAKEMTVIRILDRYGEDIVDEVLEQRGVKSLLADGLQKVVEGYTTIEEIKRVTLE